jgi:hypothetical protein
MKRGIVGGFEDKFGDANGTRDRATLTPVSRPDETFAPSLFFLLPTTILKSPYCYWCLSWDHSDSQYAHTVL